MFDAGTNSAETPRTGVSAPSLNSMGADPRFATQPVVRRAMTGVQDAPVSGPGDQDAYARKQEEKRKAEADRVALDNGAFFERLVDALEQRVLDELERRGHRHAPGVF
jgi:hypothetical protein